MRTYTINDYVITAEILIIGLAEAAHLTGVFFGWPFSRCVLLFWGVTGAALLFGPGFLLVKVNAAGKSRSRQEKHFSGEGNGEKKIFYAAEIFFLLLALSQLIFILRGDTVYVDRDLTVETVESFLATDSLYQVNPMTGFPYQSGMPLRLKILCLPTLYGSLCKAAGLQTVALVRRAVPMITLISSYIAFGALGRCLFPQSKKKRACFLAIVSLVLWTGTYLYGMDGFGLLYCGWRGVSIRNGVLLPWLLSLCLRKKWHLALLCVLAEACIVWTLYGLGACAAVLLGMVLAGYCCRVFRGRERMK